MMGETDQPPESNGGVPHSHPGGPPSSAMMRQNNGGPGGPNKRFGAYKLIVDPALVKGALKVYRFDGVIPGDPSYPSVLLRDPRKPKNLRRPMQPMILPVPAFKIDANYVGEIPPTEVTFTNLNDNVGHSFLQQLSMKFGLIESAQIYLHPISHRQLGFGHTIFKNSRDAKACVEKLNASIVMGQKVSVFHDPGGKKCQELFNEATTQKPSSSAAKDDGRKTSSSSSSASVAGTSGTSGGKPPLTKSSSTSSSTSFKQNHVDDKHVHYSHSHLYKDDGNRHTPHYDGSSIASAASEDRKSSHSLQSSLKGNSRSRDRDRDRDDGYKRFNSYDRYESSDYGYPIAGSSSRSTPSTSSPFSSYHHHQKHHYHHLQPHQQDSHPPSPLVSGTNNKRSDQHLNLTNYANNSSSPSDKMCEMEELSPKIDLDTRIKMLLVGRNSRDFGKLFSDGNISISGSENESDGEHSPLKRTRRSLGSASATIWGNESDEEVLSKKVFAKKFKQSFVPVNDGSLVMSSQNSSRGASTQQLTQNSLSPPPSPFLTLTSSSTTKSKSVRGSGKPDPEFDLISDDDGGHVGGATGGDKDDMSLSSLSPDDGTGSRIMQSRFSSHPPPPPPQSNYYGEYYNNTYTYNPNYQVQSWGSHHQQEQHPHYNSHHQHHPEYQGNCSPGYGGAPYDHHRFHHQGSHYPHAYPEERMEAKPVEEPPPPPHDDHRNSSLLVNALLELMVDDLKKVLRRDCNRRLIETEAFKMYEDWWDKQEAEFKRKQDEENAKNAPSSSTVPAPAEVIISDATVGGPKAVVISAGSKAVLNTTGLGVGLGFLNGIPKLPSFRRKMEAPVPVQDEYSRKSFVDSDSDSLSSSEEKIVSRKSKVRFDLTTTDEDSDDTSSVSFKSSVSEELHDVSDAEAISTTEDEYEFLDAKSRSVLEDSKLLPTPKIETEDILSDDESPEEFGALPGEEELERIGICTSTGRMTVKHNVNSPTKEESEEQKLLEATLAAAGDASMSFVAPFIKDELVEEEEGLLLDVEQIPVAKKEPKPEPISKSIPKGFGTCVQQSVGVDGDFLAHFDAENEQPLMIPYDVVRPRGGKKFTKTPTFLQRQDHELLDLVNEFLNEGIDIEDIVYFQKAYENFLCDDTLVWLNSTHWVNHPQTVIMKKPRPTVIYKSRQQQQQQKNEDEGSLRTRGFVRMTREEKIVGQVPMVPASFDSTLLQSIKTATSDVAKARGTQIREARSNQRHLLTVLGTESDLLKFNQLQFRKKALRFARSGIHDWGLFAAEPIAGDEMVIEYVGERIRPVIADLRETKYEAQGIGSSYLFRIDLESIIDATRCGNLSRFINHSCKPNCSAKVITIQGEKKIVIYSKQAIAVSEEITYDYKFPYEEKKIPCHCGTSQCRGTLN